MRSRHGRAARGSLWLQRAGHTQGHHGARPCSLQPPAPWPEPEAAGLAGPAPLGAGLGRMGREVQPEGERARPGSTGGGAGGRGAVWQAPDGRNAPGVAGSPQAASRRAPPRPGPHLTRRGRGALSWSPSSAPCTHTRTTQGPGPHLPAQPQPPTARADFAEMNLPFKASPGDRHRRPPTHQRQRRTQEPGEGQGRPSARRP